MKKLFTLAGAAFIFSFSAFSQGGTYKAIRTGNWSSPITWDINGVPAQNCTDCQVTISAGVTVTLDQDIFLRGRSQLTIGTDATSPAGIVIPASSNIVPVPISPIPPSIYHRLDIEYGSPGDVVVVLTNFSSFIDASNGGQFDGVYLYAKLGNPNLTDYTPITRVGQSVIYFPPTPILHGPATLSNDGTLPVKLADFTAKQDGQVIQLQWTTEIEVNADYFVIQRQANTGGFETIGKQKAIGNSSIIRHYSFTDVQPASGNNLYRLQWVNLDGTIETSSRVVAVDGPNQKNISFNNPAHSSIDVHFSSKITSPVQMSLFSLTGQLIQKIPIQHPATGVVSVPVSALPKGFYILQIKSENGEISQNNKVLVMN